MVRVLLVALLSGLLPDGGDGWRALPGVCVVAHVSADTPDPDLETVRRLFLIRQRFWPDGSAAHPVNLPASADVREAFSLAVFGQPVRDMAAYWNERYFHGTRPPPTLASEAAVLLFLERTPGGVGYVSEAAAAALPAGVRSLLCVR